MWGDVAAMWWRILGLERWTEEMMELRIGQNMSQIQPCWEEINRSWIQMFSPHRLRMPRHTKLLCGVKCASPDASGPKFGSQEPMIKSSHWVFFWLLLYIFLDVAVLSYIPWQPTSLQEIILECQNIQIKQFPLSSIHDRICLMVYSKRLFPWWFKHFSWRFLALKLIRNSYSDLIYFLVPPRT